MAKEEDTQKEQIALKFRGHFKPGRHDANSPLYEAVLCDYRRFCHVSFKFSDTGSARPGLCIYVEGEKKRDEFLQQFSSLRSDDGKFVFNKDHKARPTDQRGFITFYREGCNTLQDAYREIVDPGKERESWKAFFDKLVDEVKKFTSVEPHYYTEQDMKSKSGEKLNKNTIKSLHSTRNLIYFGAPGTGKSFKLKQGVENDFVDKNGEITTNRYERVTFYPTYSYAQFVGCYKPVMKPAVSMLGDGNKPKQAVLSEDELAKKLSEVYENASKSADEKVVASIVLFGEQYIDSFNNGTTVASVWRKSGIKSKMSGYLTAAIGAANLRQKLKEETCGGKEEIAYQFVPGPFLRVLVDALKDHAHNHCLVIEEINRANAAAVFGDVFQLLDRGGKWNDGDDESIKPFFGVGAASEYDVAASEDIKRYLKEELANCKEAPKFLKVVPGKDENGNDIWTDCRLRIPSNMYIWATMNSADQGVFPMDTAFKRRWEFKYIGIDEGVTEELKEWTIAGVSDVNGQAYKWNDVRKFINGQLSLHGVNEDKLMGPWFVKPENNKSVSADQFKSKVLMYLWEDAARMCRTKLFKKEIKTYSELTKKWPDVFADSEAWNKVKENEQADAGFNLPEGQSESDAGGTGTPAPSGS